MVQLRYSSKTKPVRPPKRWSARLPWALNEGFMRLGRRPPFVRKPKWERPPRWQNSLSSVTARFWAGPFREAVGLFVIGLAVVVGWRRLDPSLQISDLWSEVAGMTLDIFVIVIVLEIFQRRRARSGEIARQQETIEDYKAWDAPEAARRIAGAIRRLNRLGVVKLDLAGLRLSNFEFASAGIRSLAASTFYDGSWGNPHRQAEVRLVRVSFAHVDCRDVEFSPFAPFEALAPDRFRAASFLDCDFAHAELANAAFNGAELAWSEPPPDSHYDWDQATDDEGEPVAIQVSEGRFAGADLTGARFRATAFRNADFRDAQNLRSADFFRATGLEGAIFDNDDDRAYALASASRPKDRGQKGAP